METTQHATGGAKGTHSLFCSLHLRAAPLRPARLQAAYSHLLEERTIWPALARRSREKFGRARAASAMLRRWPISGGAPGTAADCAPLQKGVETIESGVEAAGSFRGARSDGRGGSCGSPHLAASPLSRFCGQAGARLAPPLLGCTTKSLPASWLSQEDFKVAPRGYREYVDILRLCDVSRVPEAGEESGVA